MQINHEQYLFNMQDAISFRRRWSIDVYLLILLFSFLSIDSFLFQIYTKRNNGLFGSSNYR